MSDHDTQVIAPVVDPARPSSAPSGAVRDELEKASLPPKPSIALKRPKFAVKLGASAGVWVGLVIAALGFGTIFYSWVKVAATLDVGRQMPYVVSGAMTGLGMIVIGIAVVDMAVRRQDRVERRQQLATMRHVLEELRVVMDKDRTPQ
jgi:hypothetical protein